jgi:hypothetical protein
MNFDEWYEGVKESLTSLGPVEALRKAWDTGFIQGFNEVSAYVLDNEIED